MDNIQLTIRNNTANARTFNLFDIGKYYKSGDYAKGYIDSKDGTYTSEYDLMTGWTKSINPTIFFKRIGNEIYLYTSASDRTNATNPVGFIQLPTLSGNYLLDEEHGITLFDEQNGTELIPE